jgi:CheY-like chemotaxis protein
MPQGGVIEVSAENITPDMECKPPLECMEYVRITVRDHGIGIPEDHLKKIFDPYFSTKRKGHGLGLAISKFIIENHNGHITAESQPEVGTTFDVYLPACPDKVAVRKEERQDKVYVGKGKILFMDNEESVIDITRIMLNSIGYEVITATDGAEAITLYREGRDSGHPFDAVIMDLTIPGGMGGEEAIQELIEIDPEAKAIVSSGYSNDPAMTDFRKYGFSDVIPKPYGLRELSEVLRAE